VGKKKCRKGVAGEECLDHFGTPSDLHVKLLCTMASLGLRAPLATLARTVRYRTVRYVRKSVEARRTSRLYGTLHGTGTGTVVTIKNTKHSVRLKIESDYFCH